MYTCTRDLRWGQCNVMWSHVFKWPIIWRKLQVPLCDVRKDNVGYNDERINTFLAVVVAAERIDAGKLFHVRGPVTGNKRSRRNKIMETRDDQRRSQQRAVTKLLPWKQGTTNAEVNSEQLPSCYQVGNRCTRTCKTSCSALTILGVTDDNSVNNLLISHTVFYIDLFLPVRVYKARIVSDLLHK